MTNRITKLIGTLNITGKEFAESVGISAGNLSDWINGRSRPTTDALIKICKKHNVDLNWLITGEGFMFLKSGDRLPPTVRTRHRAITRVPLVNYVPAGFGRIDDIPSEDYFELPLDEDDLIALRVTGESMEPDYEDRDVVFVREVPLARIKNGVDYALIYENETTIKRVFKEKEGLLLVPANPAYKPELTQEVSRAFEIKYLFREKRQTENKKKSKK